ncbi:palmitoleoyl-protein carboxylesterase NOTUM-like [Portunus trituberculatus]|nr:palmitoleoyl-protein carboxylesterase NOTUM-like [Portunus trituberculatus]
MMKIGVTRQMFLTWWRWWWYRLVVAVAVGGSAPWARAGGVMGGGLHAVVGPSLMTRLVETEAVARVAAAANRECCGLSDPTTTPLTRHWLPHARHNGHGPDPAPGDSRPAVCNDNSPAGFYLRRSTNSRRWVMFLEGGWYCFDRESCEQRWHRLRPLMTSRGWQETRTVGGVLSPHPEDNPHWWTANHVLVPYCSSDSWAGTRWAEEGSGSWSFLGSVIVEQVVRALVTHNNFTHGHKLILAGSSAGGVGVLVNVDRVARQLAQMGVRGEVRAVSDSGWFLDNEPFKPLQCVDAHSCPPVEAIRRGHELWRGRIPDHCRALYPTHPWFCYFGYRLYPTLQSPLFVFQWVFDEAQMTVDNVGKPTSKQQWDYIHGTGERLRRTFQNVTALFAPSCIAHTVLTKRNWAAVKIGDVSLPHALYCWDITPFAKLTARRQHAGEEREAVRTMENQESKEDERQTITARTRDAGRRGHRHQNRGDRKDKRQRHTGGRRRSGERSRRRRGRKRNRKGRRKSQTRRTQTQHKQRHDDDGPEVNVSVIVSQETGEEKEDEGGDSGKVQGVTQEGADLSTIGGEMLADSPKNPSPESFVVESNAIGDSQNSSVTRNGGRSGERREKARRRRRRGKKRSKNKERERKLRRRERRRKRKERRKRLPQKKRKKRKERRKGGRGRHRDNLRPVRSMPLRSPEPSHSPANTRSPNTGPTSTLGAGEVGGHAGQREELVPDEAWTEDLCPAQNLHLTDRCAWPHCNYACPKLLNPFTGEEMNFTELLKSFGLDMASVASALGIDIHTLNSMGNDELLLILTQ